MKQLLVDRASAQGWLEQSPVTPGSFFEPPDPYQPGTLVAERYQIERRVGQGGVGVLYLAADVRLDRRPVVVKLLQDRWLRSPWMRSRFRREWQALARVDHPNIVSVLDAGENTDGLAFIVMQYVPGVTVRSAIAGGPVPLNVAIRVIEQTGMAHCMPLESCIAISNRRT